MKVRLRKMSSTEFERFKLESIAEYTEDLFTSQKLSKEEAMKQAETDFIEMLPNGIETSNQCLMMIEDSECKSQVGFIWFLYEVTDGINQVFLNDLKIYEKERRKGYGAAALLEMERIGKEAGCSESILYVWKHNPNGKKLYIKAGYTYFKDADEGIYMKKMI